MKTPRIILASLLAILTAHAALAGSHSPGNPRNHSTRHSPPAVHQTAVRSASAEVCPTMTIRKGRFTRKVACTAAVASSVRCANHCRQHERGDHS